MSTNRQVLALGSAAVLAACAVTALVRGLMGVTDWSVVLLVALVEGLVVLVAYAVVLQRRSLRAARLTHEYLGRHERRESRDRHAALARGVELTALSETIEELRGRLEALTTTAAQDRAESVLAVESLRTQLLPVLGSVDGRLAAVDDRLGAAARTDDLLPVLGSVDGRLSAVDDRLGRIARTVDLLNDPDELLRRSRAEFSQIEALLELRRLTSPDHPMPPLRGWAAAPTSLLAAVRAVLEVRPDVVLECGSGSSSVWIGHVLRLLGHGRYVALEHSEHFAELSRAEVARHGLEDLVEIRHAPLTPITLGDESFSWYDTRAVADLAGIGVVFVDGPPGATGPLARYPALPVLAARCSPGAVFVLDDTARTEERIVVERWAAEGAEVVESSPLEKGFTTLRLPGR